MTIRRLVLALPLLAFAFTVRAQESTPPPPEETTPPAGESIPYDLEIGFRTLQISGNEDMYRTQINERSGLLLRSFTLLTTDPGFGTSKLVDRFRVDARDLGVGPAGSLRIEADKIDLYRFRLGYRRNNSFSALPAFANPLLGQGIIPGTAHLRPDAQLPRCGPRSLSRPQRDGRSWGFRFTA